MTPQDIQVQIGTQLIQMAAGLHPDRDTRLGTHSKHSANIQFLHKMRGQSNHNSRPIATQFLRNRT